MDYNLLEALLNFRQQVSHPQTMPGKIHQLCEILKEGSGTQLMV